MRAMFAHYFSVQMGKVSTKGNPVFCVKWNCSYVEFRPLLLGGWGVGAKNSSTGL